MDKYVNAAALFSLYEMSDKKHLLITGNIGSGKSFLIRALSKIIQNKYNYNISSIISCKTYDDKVRMDSVVYNNKLQIKNVYSDIIGRINNECTSVNARMSIVEKGFYMAGIPAIDEFISQAVSEYFIIDEIGYIESQCIDYQGKIKQLLDMKDSKVIAVIRKKNTEFINYLKNRKDVLVVDIDEAFADISCIIMASGKSKRFGSDKLIETFGSNSLIENALKIADNSPIKNIFVITGNQNVISKIANCKYKESDNITIVKHNKVMRNEVVGVGMEHIINAEHLNPKGIMFLQADQPLISQESMHLLCLTFTYNNDKICRLSHNGVAGSPVIFPNKFFKELCQLPDNKGGSYVIKQHPKNVLLVPAYSEYEMYDIDTREDLDSLREFIGH